MAINTPVYKELRMVPVRFERAITGDPDENSPDLDDRGHNFKVPAVEGLAESKEIRGPVVGLRKQQKIKLRLVRECIDNAAPLFITSSDESTIKVIDPAAGVKLASGRRTVIELQGGDFAQAKPKTAKIEVRYEAKDGPIIFELTVYVFSPLPVFVKPYLVTINNMAGAGGVAPAINLNAVMTQAKALWACCGIRLIVQGTESFPINLPTAGQMRWEDVNTVLAAKWQANCINVYVVREIVGALGYGISKAAHAGFGISKPCVFAGGGQGDGGGVLRGGGDIYWWANDVAHELGHFFTLWHPTDDPDPRWWDTWSMRFLMHNHNYTERGIPPGNPADWPTHNDFGYGMHAPGEPFRGAMVPLKNVHTASSAGRDAQCSEARSHILKGPASLY